MPATRHSKRLAREEDPGVEKAPRARKPLSNSVKTFDDKIVAIGPPLKPPKRRKSRRRPSNPAKQVTPPGEVPQTPDNDSENIPKVPAAGASTPSTSTMADTNTPLNSSPLARRPKKNTVEPEDFNPAEP